MGAVDAMRRAAEAGASHGSAPPSYSATDGASDAAPGGSKAIHLGEDEDNEEAAESILDALRQAEGMGTGMAAGEQMDGEQRVGTVGEEEEERAGLSNDGIELSPAMQALHAARQAMVASQRRLAIALDERVITLVGPPGLASLVLCSLKASYSFLTVPLEIIEMHPADSPASLASLASFSGSEVGRAASCAGAGASHAGAGADENIRGLGGDAIDADWPCESPWGTVFSAVGRNGLSDLRGLLTQYGTVPVRECGPLAGVRVPSADERDAAWETDPECKILLAERSNFSQNGFCPQLTVRVVAPSPVDGLWHLPLRAGASENAVPGRRVSPFVELVEAGVDESKDGRTTGAAGGIA